MALTTETELKLAVAARDLARISRLPWLRAMRRAPARTRYLTSLYHDTHDGRLWGRGVTVRVRAKGAGDWVQTVKAGGQGSDGVFSRVEWEDAIAEPVPDLDRPRAAGLEAALAGVDEKALRPRFATEIRRTEVRLSDGSWTILMALDRGTVTGDGRDEPIHEVELELVEGTAGDLYRLGLRIAEAVPVRMEVRSKAARGHDLVVGASSPTPVKGRPPALRPDMTVAGSFQAIAAGCLSQMIGNVRPLWECRDGEAVHQMRVAMRRLRSAMTTFGPVVAGPELEAVKTDLRWLMGILGPARDADVFLTEILSPVRACFPGDRGLESLSGLFAARRDARFDAAVAAMADPRLARLLLRVGAWIEDGDWLAAPDRPIRDGPVLDFARTTLQRRWRKVAKPARRFQRLSEAKRHRLRIQVKKVRYTAEFFVSLFARKPAKRFLSGLSDLQDDLGALNDVAVAGGVLHNTLAEQRAGDDVAAAAERAWAAGLVTGWHRRDAAERMDHAARSLERVRRAAGYWA
ncbi:CYTH and CHAD domain-containing protein [Rhodospira trueperi]|uniref:Inorganic triphosphatase YgiF, contains CYTH and CHAD domains n=1 Tax=Rhodospira trueperi TaxID=69960 RepID=A0A1G6XR25_9PROT|nr:CYTH and CHAD domain-containing protein [Rhodospira trueperi]SDD80669.1 Inorganic triphosphatase YgiF, contains CYTH and CHAD domains [Rhodospira trueperi]